MGKTLVSIVGPTAIGKTSLSIALAKHFKTEIISADSRQFYKEMKIGTAAPSFDDLRKIPHHFIHHISIQDHYTVGDFERDASLKLEELHNTKEIVIMVGGSGLYIDAVAKGLDNFPNIPKEVRRKLNQQFKENGLAPLQDKLKTLDPTTFSKIDLKNPRRVIRALEVCIFTGKPYSGFLEKHRRHMPFKTVKIGLMADRLTLYQRIEERVDKMMTEGLLEEAARLKPHRSLNALNTIGYKELFNYLEKKWTLEFAISEIKKNTRRLAKRQLTWFRRNPEIFWFDHDVTAMEVAESLKTTLT